VIAFFNPYAHGDRVTRTWQYGNVDDVPKAARHWPQLCFLINYSAIRSGG